MAAAMFWPARNSCGSCMRASLMMSQLTPRACCVQNPWGLSPLTRREPAEAGPRAGTSVGDGGDLRRECARWRVRTRGGPLGCASAPTAPPLAADRRRPWRTCTAARISLPGGYHPCWRNHSGDPHSTGGRGRSQGNCSSCPRTMTRAGTLGRPCAPPERRRSRRCGGRTEVTLRTSEVGRAEVHP